MTASTSASAPWYYQTKSSVPLPAVFELTTIANGAPVVAFTRQTRDAIIQGLSTQGWMANEVLGPATTSIKKGGALGIAALDGMRAAAAAGMNVYVDADLGLKVGGTGTAPDHPAFVAVSDGVGIAPAVNPDDDAMVLADPADAVRCLDPAVPGMQYVLFARAGETF